MHNLFVHTVAFVVGAVVMILTVFVVMVMAPVATAALILSVGNKSIEVFKNGYRNAKLHEMRKRQNIAQKRSLSVVPNHEMQEGKMPEDRRKN